MLLIFNNNFESDPGDYVCGPHVVETKYLEGSTIFKRRDFVGRDTRAIVPAITVCNQNLRAIFEDRKLQRYIPEQE